MSSEAQARIKIDRLLQDKGWRFFDDENGKANIQLESRTTRKKYSIDELGNNFEKTTNGFIDYLLLDNLGNAVAVLEAKREGINPLDAKQQAKEYAESLNVRFVFLSNGNVHYYWDLEQGNPIRISQLLSIDELGVANEWNPDASQLVNLPVDENFIAVSQDPNWLNYTPEQQAIEKVNQKIRVLRSYQLEAVHAIQHGYNQDKRRFLFEMATGTGKTLVSAAIIKLFIRSNNANRVLFLVDRLELERQTHKDFVDYMAKDAIKSIVYKQNKHTWSTAKIVITTIQTLARNNHYREAFSPNDFQLVITDEAHRTIGGNGRTIFEYFTGTKLGLTATPKDYLKGVDLQQLQANNPSALERRLLLDSYETFGCSDGQATFVYSLLDAVRHDPPYLVNPKKIDARTDVTTRLLSEQGWAATFTDEEGNESETTYGRRDFHRHFFSRPTNVSFVKTFLKNAKKDPITGEIGKSIVFAVNRRHAEELTEIFNEEIEKRYPNHYHSSFAVQITSNIPRAQESTIAFAKNHLNGQTQFKLELIDYESSKTRVCVTVGMMTTGYNCQDLLNIVLARPIFSPSLFVQIKGRGTRLYDFKYNHGATPLLAKKDNFYLFDFFANCEYFEEEFDYDARIRLINEDGGTFNPGPPDEGEDPTGGGGGGRGGKTPFYYMGNDEMLQFNEQQVGQEGMRIDREMFRNFERDFTGIIRDNPELEAVVAAEDWDTLEAFVMKNLFNDDLDAVDKMLFTYIKAHNIDRKIGLSELMMLLLDKIEAIKSRQKLADDYFENFLSSSHNIDTGKYNDIRRLFHAYLMYEDVRQKIDEKKLAFLTTPINFDDLKKIGKHQVDLTVDYIKQSVPLGKFKTIN